MAEPQQSAADFYAARYAERCGQLAMAQARIEALEKALEQLLEATYPFKVGYLDGKLEHDIWGNFSVDLANASIAARALTGDAD